MAVKFVMRITFLLLLAVAFGFAEGAPPMAKPNCPDRCGNVSIPYPFGIGSDCFMHQSFEIVCNGSGAAAIAFLPSIRMEVLKIRITDPSNTDESFSEAGLIRVMMPIISSNCINKSSVAGSGGVVDISGTSFFFSPNRDKFVSVGCNKKATMAVLSMVIASCKTDCNNQKLRGKCSGFDCCQTTIPSYGIQLLNVTWESTTNNMHTCKHAFLAETWWLESNETDPSNDVQYLEYVPVMLEWTIPTAIINLNGTEARRRNIYLDHTPFGTTSYCLSGYEGNPYLNMGCQDINECEDQKYATCQVISNSECENTEGSYSCKMREKQKSPLKTAIIVICTSFGVLFLLLFIWWLYKVIRKRNKIKLKHKFFKRNGGLLLQQQLSSNENNVQKAKLFNSKELKNATDCFNENRILGKGGQGTVYKGMLINGRIVAIKKCNTVDEGNLEQFINEIIILSQINHRNVVKLLGCCLETEVPLLVYEFISNGTLFQYLHEENEDFPLLTWDMRLRIATEIAGALSYLHSAASLPIYHRDIKSSNILIDDKYRAKVADFGTSRSVAIDQTHVTTLVYGTFGYLDPEYFQTSQFTDKSDVYSFGVVLIELLTGEKPVSSTRSAESRNLSTYFVHSLKENCLFDILDTQVRKVCNKDEVIAIANLAKRCLHLNGKKRPTMLEIMMELEGVQKVSHVQPNFDELEYVRNEEMGPQNDVSISASSCLELRSTSLSDALPLLSFKSV
ncbi:LOW QUALITY PROTEIN: wall-associated receptor kinase-like 8 [Quercus suber]|uniref:LOW QUALITY PROTEIN: wall-associated receptor kinase-like 8 n=1 Tax=Quercus suber TaxID=58331 RepID=UPI0032DF7638